MRRAGRIIAFVSVAALGLAGCGAAPERPAPPQTVAVSWSDESTSAPAPKAALRVTGWSRRPITVAPGQRYRDTVTISPGRTRLVLTMTRPGTPWRRTRAVAVDGEGRATVSIRLRAADTYRIGLTVPGARTPWRRLVVTGERPGPGVTYAYVAGDVGECGGAPAATARLIPPQANVIVPGDVAYPKGTRADFNSCYLPSYGRFLDRTYPVPGNHEYYDPALAYFDFFGRRVGTPADPWYRTRLGSWQFLMLNSNCDAVGGCGQGSRQYRWLQAQLAGSPNRCLAAVWHAPRWSSGKRGSDPAMAAMSRLLQRAGTDLLLSGHDHSYERFARLAAAGTRSPAGLRQIVVGTGGAELYRFRTPLPGSEVRAAGHHGVLRLRLAPDGYGWQFLATDGATVDRGSDTC